MSKNSSGGSHIWFVPDCFYPSISSPGHYVSHEAVCVLNTGKEDAHLKLTLYFEDREPMSGFQIACGAKRTNHIRLDKLRNEEEQAIPQDVPYAVMVESDQPVIVQYSRLDTTQAEMGLMTTMAYPIHA